jgi:CRP/FNR family transcriptional regulator, cyclic AMP receptor protein
MARILTTRIEEGTSLASPANGWRPGWRMERSKIAVVPHTLAGIAIFAGLTPKALEAVHRRCSWRPFEAGEPIVDYLDSSDDVFFVASGETSVTIYSVGGKAVSFRSLGPGEIFGEYAAIDGEPRSASVEARSSCLIASMSAKEFRKLLQTEPVVAYAVLKGLVRNVRSLTKRVYEFSTLAVNNRIQAELLRLARLAPREGHSARLEPAPTHADIASRVSTHREAVTRELNRLSRMGIIERQKGSLIIWDLDRLAAMLHEMTGE